MTDHTSNNAEQNNEAKVISDETILHNLTLLETAACLMRGNTIADLKGITEEQLEAIYAIALQHFDAENYEEALPLFQILAMYDGQKQKYFMGLAACQQKLGKYEMASNTFANAAIISGLKDPQPMYFAAINLLKLNRKDDAITTLKAIEVMGRDGNAEDDLFKEKAQALMKVLQAEESK